MCFAAGFTSEQKLLIPVHSRFIIMSTSILTEEHKAVSQSYSSQSTISFKTKKLRQNIDKTKCCRDENKVSVTGTTYVSATSVPTFVVASETTNAQSAGRHLLKPVWDLLHSLLTITTKQINRSMLRQQPRNQIIFNIMVVKITLRTN